MIINRGDDLGYALSLMNILAGLRIQINMIHADVVKELQINLILLRVKNIL